jgi:hypothetical protein
MDLTIAVLIAVFLTIFLVPFDRGMGMGWYPPLGIQGIIWLVKKIRDKR